MKSQAWCRAVAALSATVLLAPSSAFGGGFGIRIDLPQIPAAPHIPTPGEINKAATKAVDSAGQAVGQVSTNAAKEAGIGLGNVAREAQIGAGNVAREGQIGAGNVAREAQIGAGNVATTIRKAGSDTGRQLNRSQHDLEDAGTAIYRFSVNEARGTQASINHAEERFRQGKVVDAFFTLLPNTCKTPTKTPLRRHRKARFSPQSALWRQRSMVGQEVPQLTPRGSHITKRVT